MTIPLPEVARTRNGRFAKAAFGFVKRVAAAPGARVMPLVGLGAICLATLTGSFGTGAMPWPSRTALWTLLIGWNVAKWQCWFALRIWRPNAWTRGVALGAMVLNLPLPLEIVATLRLFNIAAPIGLVGVWMQALAVSATIGGVLFALRRPPTQHKLAASPKIGGLLTRAGVTADQLLGVEAEDHYCRMHLADGRSMLYHYRFGDALAELERIDGVQVHRGAWVAAHGVRANVREGRHWRLVLTSGAQLPVSARYTPAVRARGWLQRRS